jgi:hypothetical protein
VAKKPRTVAKKPRTIPVISVDIDFSQAKRKLNELAERLSGTTPERRAAKAFVQAALALVQAAEAQGVALEEIPMGSAFTL